MWDYSKYIEIGFWLPVRSSFPFVIYQVSALSSFQRPLLGIYGKRLSNDRWFLLYLFVALVCTVVSFDHITPLALHAFKVPLSFPFHT